MASYDVALLFLDTEPVKKELTALNATINHNNTALLVRNKLVVSSEHPVWAAVERGHLQFTERTLQNVTADIYVEDLFPTSLSPGYKSLLHCACASGNVEVIRFLVQAGADINGQWPGDDGFTNPTPFKTALLTSREDAARMLIQTYPAALESQMSFSTVLQHGLEDMVQPFLEAGADVDGIVNNTCLLGYAIMGHNINVVRALLDAGAKVNHVNQSSIEPPETRICSPLEVAFNSFRAPESVEIARLLVSRGATLPAEPVYDLGIFKQWVLGNRIEMMELFLEHFELPDRSLLGEARNPAMFNLLLQHGLEVRDASRSDQNSLIQHAHLENGEESDDLLGVLELLLPHLTNVNVVNEYGDSAVAVLSGPYDAIKEGPSARERIKLLVAHGADHSLKNDMGLSPIHHTARKSFVGCMEELLSAGADIEAQGMDDMTPLHFAAHNYTTKSIEVLLKSGANIQARAKRGLTPLHLAYTTGDAGYGRFSACTPMYPFFELRKRLPIIEFFLTHGADPLAKTNDGVPALHVPHIARREALIRLLDRGADPGREDLDGKLVLSSLVCLKHHLKDAEVVLHAHGHAVVNQQTREGETPLMIAARHVLLETAELLLLHGAEINARMDTDGLTALDMVPRHTTYSREEELAHFKTFMRSRGALLSEELES
jgi:ankyrin repeat protein